jgi:hypothetical protein
MKALPEPITIAEWWRDRGGRSVRVRLTSYEGNNLVDIRTWDPVDGRLVPGKGFACGVRHLPRLIDALNTALDKARELNLFRGKS